MWVALFAIAIVVAVLLSITAFVMRDRAVFDKIVGQPRKSINVKFDKAVRRLSNMSEMTKRLGFDSKTFCGQESNIRFVFEACQNCSADDECYSWFMRVPNSLGHVPAFCANAKRFAHVRQECV